MLPCKNYIVYFSILYTAACQIWIRIFLIRPLNDTDNVLTFEISMATLYISNCSSTVQLHTNSTYSTLFSSHHQRCVTSCISYHILRTDSCLYIWWWSRFSSSETTNSHEEIFDNNQNVRINAATFAALKCIPTSTTSLDRLSTILRVPYTKLYQYPLCNSYRAHFQFKSIKDDICDSFGFIAKKVLSLIQIPTILAALFWLRQNY